MPSRIQICYPPQAKFDLKKAIAFYCLITQALLHIWIWSVFRHLAFEIYKRGSAKFSICRWPQEKKLRFQLEVRQVRLDQCGVKYCRVKKRKIKFLLMTHVVYFMSFHFAVTPSLHFSGACQPTISKHLCYPCFPLSRPKFFFLLPVSSLPSYLSFCLCSCLYYTIFLHFFKFLSSSVSSCPTYSLPKHVCLLIDSTVY